MAFIPTTGIDYDSAFTVKSMDLSLNSQFSYKNNTISPSIYGLDINIPFVSGHLAENTINLSWTVEKPITQQILSGTIRDAGFSGFDINYYDINRKLIYSLPFSIKQSTLSVDSSDVLQAFVGVTGVQNISGLNKFFIDAVSTDNQGRKSTGIALIDFGTPSVNINSYSIDNFVNVGLSYQDNSIINKVSVFVTTGTIFNPDVDDYLYNVEVKNPNLNTVYIPDLTSINQNIESDNFVRQPYYLHFVPYNYFYSGQKIVSSGIKPNSYSVSSLPNKLLNLTGYVSSSLNRTDKNLNLEAFIKWDHVEQSQDCSFHILVEESGTNKNKYDYFLDNRISENIQSIYYGTGSGVSGSSNIFTTYGSSGIQWVDHTIYVDNFGSYPTGIFATTTGFNYITEIRIPSGYTDSSEVFLSYNYTGNNEFQFLPSGGYFSGNIYTGTYSDSRYLPIFAPNNNGFNDLNDTVTGIQIAKRITGFANFVYSTVDPSFIFPVKEDTNYFVKVRAINTDEVVSEFSDSLFISSG